MQQLVNSITQAIPFYAIDGIFNQEDIESVWEAFDNAEWVGEKESGSANIDGELLKSNKGKNVVFNNNFCFENPFPFKTNSLLNTLHNVIYVNNEHWFWRNLKSCTGSQVVGAAYNEGDEYKNHFDIFKITAVSFFEKSNEPVSGGDFIIENTATVPFAHNRTVIFPSIANHQVTPVLKNTRYSVTLFLW